jgi:AcrR family transcriptional regulator
MATAVKRRYAPRLPPAERREQLLDAALAVIAEGGYAGVSMESVARAAGVTKPVVYDLFANRGELLRALLRREEARAFEALAAAMPQEPTPDADPDQVLVAGATAFLRAVAENPTPWRLILMPADGTPAAVREHVERGRRLVVAQLESLIAWGVERRGGPAGLDAEMAAQALVAVGEQAARLTLTDPARFPPERFSALARTLLGALGPPSRSAQGYKP